MPLLSILRLGLSLLSWVILGTAIYLIWQWYEGDLVLIDAATDTVVRRRESWPLWLGLGLTAWSFLGRFFWKFILASGSEEPRPERGNGSFVPGADGARLYVETSGNADHPVLLFTHGAGVDSTAWYLAKRQLGDRYRIVTWDLPGLGKSKAGEITLDAYAENLRLVVQLVRKPLVLVGHSMGGMTIQTLARRHPELFGTAIIGAVLLNTTYTNPLKTMILSGLARALQPLLKLAFRVQAALYPLFWLGAWQSYLSGSAHIANRFTFGKGVTRTQLDHVALLGTRNSPASIARGNLAMIDWDATGAIAAAEDPVLIVAGHGDIVTKPEASHAIADMALEPRLHVIEHANHMSFLDHAPTYAQLIDDYARDAVSRATVRHVVT